jgi:hypothetical protein
MYLEKLSPSFLAGKKLIVSVSFSTSIKVPVVIVSGFIPVLAVNSLVIAHFFIT